MREMDREKEKEKGERCEREIVAESRKTMRERKIQLFVKLVVMSYTNSDTSGLILPTLGYGNFIDVGYDRYSE